MPATNPPHDAADQLAWMVDREAIRDLVNAFGVAVDDKDSAGYAANFTDDGVVELPFGRFEGIAAIAAMHGPPAHVTTHHLFGNIVIALDGDTASVRSYLMATHAFDATDRTKKAHSGGWYEQRVVRTPQGWRFTHVRLVICWEDERPMIQRPPTPTAAPTAVPAAAPTAAPAAAPAALPA